MKGCYMELWKSDCDVERATCEYEASKNYPARTYARRTIFLTFMDSSWCPVLLDEN